MGRRLAGLQAQLAMGGQILLGQRNLAGQRMAARNKQRAVRRQGQPGPRQVSRVIRQGSQQAQLGAPTLHQRQHIVLLTHQTFQFHTGKTPGKTDLSASKSPL